MGAPYAGNPALYPADYVIPDDADPPTATAVNIGLEALGDRTEFIRTHGGSGHALVELEYATPGTFNWVVPAGVLWIWVFLIGAGGGGGAGSAGSDTTTASSGGGGGGGAVGQWHLRATTPGETLTFIIGNGGLGGSTSGTAGANGENTTFFGSGIQLDAYGGSGGQGGLLTLAPSTTGAFAPGGGPGLAQRLKYSTVGSYIFPHQGPGDGGWSCSVNAGSSSSGQLQNLQHLAGRAVGGASGSTVSGARGGGGGGGGGSSTLGPGGVGGAGGNGNNAGAGAAGATGASATSVGSGGGGGGGAGAGSTGSAAFGAGGNGVSGLARIRYVNPVLAVP